MARDKDKLLRIMDSLEHDYRSGNISEEKYLYFRQKYEEKLNAMDKTSVQREKYTKMPKKPLQRSYNESEQQKLIEKYIVDPKRSDKALNSRKKKKKQEMSSGTFKWTLVLILVIAFTAGIGLGIFGFDFGDISVMDVSAIVQDTAFPVVEEVHVDNSTNVTSTTNSNSSQGQGGQGQGGQGGQGQGGQSQGGQGQGGSGNLQ